MSEPTRDALPGAMINPAAGRWRPFDTLSIGGWLILGIAIVSTIAVLFWPIPRVEGMRLWTFSRGHGLLYERVLSGLNDHDPLATVDVSVIDLSALTRRTLSGFWSGTPVADLIEVERSAMTQFVSGPLEHIGFVDLTDRLEAEGLFERINRPSFSPWTSRGRVFGLPHDVHPVMLCYRADIVEAAGIDVSQIETWDDFVDVMGPLIADLNGDGRPDRYLLNLWYTQMHVVEALILQAGGGTFDENDRSLIASSENARVLAQCVAWMVGPGRIAIDAPNFDPSGNHMKLNGLVVAEIMPDWLAGVYTQDLSQLSGKLKLMPLPAWERSGRRTSVMGGTMLGIPKSARDFEAAWSIAKQLYFTRQTAEELWRENRIISPVRDFWDESFYAQPDPYFSGQRSGQLFVEQAPHVPLRSSNPFHTRARTLIGEALTDLHQQAEAGQVVPVDELTPEALEPRAQELLKAAQHRLEQEMGRNIFLQGQANSEESSR